MKNRPDFESLNLAQQMANDPTVPIVDVRNVPPKAEKVDVSDVAPEYEPVNKAIWVKPDQVVERVEGKIVIPTDKNKKEERTGLVLSSGSELCKAGDKIVWARVAGIWVEGETRFVVSETDVIGVKRCSQKA